MSKHFCLNTLLKVLFYVAMMIAIVFILLKFNPAIGEDEPFTMALVHHSFHRMIYLSYFDVHPPLYYIILKLFLVLTTFWTESILIKIVFAKLLSFLFFIMTFIELSKLLKYLKINVNWRVQLIAYLLVLSTVNFSFQIRMYEMATAFLSIELLHLVKFVEYSKTYNLIIAIISASIASYTHYFSAMFAGSLFLVLMFQELRKCDMKNVYKIMCSGLLFLVLFIPCIKFAHRQLLYTASSQYSNNPQHFSIEHNLFIEIIGSVSGMNFSNYLSLVFCLFISFFMIYLSILCLRNIDNSSKYVLCTLLMTFIISLVLPIVFSVVNHPIIQGRYFYPIVTVYEFILINSVLKLYKDKFSDAPWFNYILVFCLIAMTFGMGGKASNQLKMEDIPSIKSYQAVKTNNYSQSDPLKDSIYLESSKKSHRVVIESNENISHVLGSNNKKLFYNVFNNIYLK